MNVLLRALGYPHELLHALALLLIGKRALRITRRHVDIPDDLTLRQYLFVAGFPALVFFGGAALAVLGLLNAHTWGQAVLALVMLVLGGLGAASTAGDLQLIALRLQQEEKQVTSDE
jgi:hypothetical protein